MADDQPTVVALDAPRPPFEPLGASLAALLALIALVAAGIAAGAVVSPVHVLGGLAIATLAFAAWRYPGIALVALVLLLPFNVAIFTALVKQGGAHVGRLGDWKDGLIVLLFVRGVVARWQRDRTLRLPGGALNRFLIAYILFYCLIGAASPHLGPVPYALSRIIEGPLLFLAIVALRPSRQTVAACLYALLAAACIVGLAALYERLGPHQGFVMWFGSARPGPNSSFFPGGGGYRSGSFLDSPLILAFYLAVAAPVSLGVVFAFRQRRALRVLAVLATAACVAGIIAAETRSGYLGGGFGILLVLLFGLHNNAVRAALIGIFVIVVAVAVIQNQHSSALTRPGEDTSKRHALEHDFNVIASNPLGLGLGSIDAVGQRFGISARGATASESELLARGIEGGVAALLLYPASLLLLILYLVNLRRRAGAAGDSVTVGLAAGAAGAAAAVLTAGLFLGIDELVIEVGVWGPAALAVAWYRARPAPPPAGVTDAYVLPEPVAPATADQSDAATSALTAPSSASTAVLNATPVVRTGRPRAVALRSAGEQVARETRSLLGRIQSRVRGRR
jgi:hypothetical protein